MFCFAFAVDYTVRFSAPIPRHNHHPHSSSGCFHHVKYLHVHFLFAVSNKHFAYLKSFPPSSFQVYNFAITVDSRKWTFQKRYSEFDALDTLVKIRIVFSAHKRERRRKMIIASTKYVYITRNTIYES
jgi:hypothetical protein